MPTENVLVAEPVDDAWVDELRARHPSVTIDVREPIVPGAVLTDDELRERTVLFADHCPANADALRNLRWIQLGSAGYQQLAGLDLPAGLRVSNASGVNDRPIAEWCVLMMLTFARDLPTTLRNQEARRYDRDTRFQAELQGLRVGILGYGSIGREVGRLAAALGMEIWAASRSGTGARPGHYRAGGDDAAPELPPARGFSLDELADFLPGLDFVVIATPLTAQTRGLIGARELAQLPRHAVLLNPARAHVVDEAALLAALREGRLGGAALDSHYREPMPPDDPFWTAPRTVVTPHVSGSTGSTHFGARLRELFAANLDRYLVGKALLNEIAEADWRTPLP